MTQFQGAVFDCDGTLLRSIDVWRNLENDLAQQAGVEITKEISDELVTCTIPEVGDMFHNRFGLGSSIEDVLEIIHAHMLDFYSHDVVMRAGAEDFVRRLRNRGIPCAVASSTPSDLLEAGLSHVGIRDCFCAVLSVDDVGKSKRDPDVFLAAAEACGATPQACWGFEDSVYALNTLRAAGFHTLGIFDRDDAGTFEQLQQASDITIREFTDLDGATFPSMA